MTRSIAVVAVSALAALAALLPGDAEAVAARADFDFRGKWNLELRTPVGDISGRVSLQPNGKGRVWLGPGRPLPLVHQYAPEWISWTLELPAVQTALEVFLQAEDSHDVAVDALIRELEAPFPFIAVAAEAISHQTTLALGFD